MLISVIISTNNRPKALSLVLQALNFQTDKNFEVIIAENNSDIETRKLVAQMTINCVYPITHVNQDDCANTFAKIKNIAANKAKGSYLIFLDGNCIPRPNFIKKHRKLAQKNTLIVGNKIDLSDSFSKKIELQKIDIWNKGFCSLISYFVTRKINKISPLFGLNLNLFRSASKKILQLQDSHFALHKEDYQKVNGLDNSLDNLHIEDCELAARLCNAGLSIKESQIATCVLHLFNEDSSRNNVKESFKILQDVVRSNKIHAIDGLNEIQ